MTITAEARIIVSSEERGWRGLEAHFLRLRAGLTSAPATAFHRLAVHFGSSVNTDCRCDGHRHLRLESHGDMDILPAGLEGLREDDADCSILLLCLTPTLLKQVAEDLGGDPDKVALKAAFQLREPRLESVAWAIKAELESVAPSDRLYAESLGVALAVRLIGGADRASRVQLSEGQMLSPAQCRKLTEFIEANLDQSISLLDLASVANLSVSHFKTLFRRTFGTPAHQYVVRRRVERAKLLLLSGSGSLSEVALATGFAHQSHMARCMRRVLGLPPSALVKLRD
jgi:AraC family transcriptional regulator